jgi:hypothetical protein
MRAVKIKMKMKMGYLLGFWWNAVGLLGSRGSLEGSLGFASEEECLTSSSSAYSTSSY